MTSLPQAREPLRSEGEPVLKPPSRPPSVSPTRNRVKQSHRVLLLLQPCRPLMRVRVRFTVCRMGKINVPIAMPVTPQPPPRKQWYDKLADAILGDDDPTGSPSSRYALICQKCFAHNGLVKESVWQDTREFRANYRALMLLIVLQSMCAPNVVTSTPPLALSNRASPRLARVPSLPRTAGDQPVSTASRTHPSILSQFHCHK